MKKIIYISVVLLAVMFSNGAYAIPTLQLDIGGGTYDWSTETIVSSSNPFMLYAYLKPDSKNLLGDTYYISMAVVPILASSSSLGSFSFAGDTIDVTGDMTYGTPPFETIYTLIDPGDLSKHGIFETYYYEQQFNFSESNKTWSYNTQEQPGGPKNVGTEEMYYASFLVNTASLDSEYVIHFDLYNTKIKDGVDIDVTQFAPFSHDAESRHKVPEPTTLLLLGFGLAGLAGVRRKFKK